MALAAAGAHILCAACDTVRLENSVTAMVRSGYAAESRVRDQTDLRAHDSVLGDGAFDIVVNSAGGARHSPTVAASPESFDAVLDLSLRSTYSLFACPVRDMIAAGKPGSFIHISSQMGQVGGVDRAVCWALLHAPRMIAGGHEQLGPNSAEPRAGRLAMLR
ncbi:SDR family oxidoreductase [Phaeobacter sp. B1627]|nr:SDR family oxidoreductase [Phaeobacter sp. B1627]